MKEKFFSETKVNWKIVVCMYIRTHVSACRFSEKENNFLKIFFFFFFFKFYFLSFRVKSIFERIQLLQSFKATKMGGWKLRGLGWRRRMSIVI